MNLNELNINNHDFFMFLCSWHKLVLYYATYIIINIKTLIESKKKKKIKHNNPLKSVVVKHLAEQHLIQKYWQVQKRH